MPDLLSSLKEWHERKSPLLVERGVKVGIFESPEGRDKNSFGISFELGSRISYLTAWDSGEIQISSIDLDTDSAPKEEYRENVPAGDLPVIADRLASWVFRISRNS
ncbi:immunity protein TriTu family protein [Kitasatospora sp. NBC_01266]|uniref:immunity protein TriTu family protein n=1 Tax=Kitasatospora sp. NBC_01266 TaxID=2903572 RepID=UPI002E31AA0E|nr:hypothetical protein [Kitasatospora sp. NBC_01266]